MLNEVKIKKNMGIHNRQFYMQKVVLHNKNDFTKSKF